MCQEGDRAKKAAPTHSHLCSHCDNADLQSQTCSVRLAVSGLQSQTCSVRLAVSDLQCQACTIASCVNDQY